MVQLEKNTQNIFLQFRTSLHFYPEVFWNAALTSNPPITKRDWMLYFLMFSTIWGRQVFGIVLKSKTESHLLNYFFSDDIYSTEQQNNCNILSRRKPHAGFKNNVRLLGNYLFYIRWKHIYINTETIFFLINLVSVDLSTCTYNQSYRMEDY